MDPVEGDRASSGSIFFNQGRVHCCAGSRLVRENVKDEVVNRLQGATLDTSAPR
jgi:acyl-CoA reductase-like NAD-dependent aldehyde dehydrogenase